MNLNAITSALIVAVLGFSLSLPGSATAGDRQHDRHGSGHSGGHHYKPGRQHHHNYKRHNRRHHGHKRHHYKGHHYRPHYGYRGHGGNYYYYDDDDDYDELLFGLVTGGILGYWLNQGRGYAYPPPPGYAPY